MIRPMASTRTKRTSSCLMRGLFLTAARARSSISVMHSMPAKPPPTTTKVRARARSTGSVMSGAGFDPLEHAVAQGYGFLDGLQADALVREALDGERAGDRACGHHDVEVGNLEVLAAVGRGHDGRAVGVVDRRDAALDELGLLEVLAVRDDGVACLDVAAGNFGEEGLVGHVGQGINDGDDATGIRDLLLQFEGYVQADVPAADDEYPGTVLELRGGCHSPRIPYFVKNFTNYGFPVESTESSTPVSGFPGRRARPSGPSGPHAGAGRRRLPRCTGTVRRSRAPPAAGTALSSSDGVSATGTVGSGKGGRGAGGGRRGCGRCAGQVAPPVDPDPVGNRTQRIDPGFGHVVLERGLGVEDPEPVQRVLPRSAGILGGADDSVDDLVGRHFRPFGADQGGNTGDDGGGTRGAGPFRVAAAGHAPDQVLRRGRNADADALGRGIDAGRALAVQAGDGEHAGNGGRVPRPGRCRRHGCLRRRRSPRPSARRTGTPRPSSAAIPARCCRGRC